MNGIARLRPLEAAFAGALGSTVVAIAIIEAVYASNLGPLIAIMVATPFGAVLGYVLALIRDAAAHHPDRDALHLLVVAWCAALAYSWFILGIAPRLAAGAVAIHIVCGVGALRLARIVPNGRAARVFAATAMAVAATVALPLCTSAETPLRFMWLFDRRLDASRHVPQFNVSRLWLIAEWAFVSWAAWLAARRLRVDAEG